MMGRLVKAIGNIRMTTTILVLVLGAIIASIGAVSASIYFNLRAQSLADSLEQQETNLGVAATILERRISGSVLEWNEDGTIAKFQSWAIPPFYDTEVIDSVTRVTRQDATIYVSEGASGDMVAKTTSVAQADGTRAIDMRLGPDSPAYAPLIAGQV